VIGMQESNDGPFMYDVMSLFPFLFRFGKGMPILRKYDPGFDILIYH
jgi:hypothetical protein